MRQTNLILVAVVLLASAAQLSGQPAIYIVRHAEKAPVWLGEELDDFHPLSEAGVVRARKLAAQFDKGALAAIFSSRTTRTLHTVQPLAEKLGLPVQLSPACWDTTAIDSAFAELAAKFKPDQSVLLVSHSNIIPYVLMRAGLPVSCRQAMSFAVAPDGAGWWVIEGFDNIWRIKKAGPARKGCGDFERRKY